MRPYRGSITTSLRGPPSSPSPPSSLRGTSAAAFAIAFKLITFGARITSLDGGGRRTKRNRSIAKAGKLNVTLSVDTKP